MFRKIMLIFKKTVLNIQPYMVCFPSCWCKDYCHRVKTQLQIIIIIIIIIIIRRRRRKYVSTIPGHHEVGELQKLSYWTLHTYCGKCYCKSTLETTQQLVIWAP
jgi:translation initiation factor 1 (eIF-1/SUI1)